MSIIINNLIAIFWSALTKPTCAEIFLLISSVSSTKLTLLSKGFKTHQRYDLNDLIKKRLHGV